MAKDNLIFKLEINNFSEYIKKANSVRPIPYIKDRSRLPIKYSDEELFEWRKIKYRGKYIEARFDRNEADNKKFLISNSKSAGKPRLVKVNGQDIYNQSGSSFGRSFTRNILHDFFKEYIKENNLKPIDDIDKYPLYIWMKFYLHDMGRRNIDNDNKWVWEKFFQDSLTEAGIIPDDNNQYINDNRKTTYFIPEGEPQKLVIGVFRKGEEDEW